MSQSLAVLATAPAQACPPQGTGAPLLEQSVEAGVALIGLAAPPVNALGAGLRAALLAALAAQEADPAVEAIVLYGSGRLFSAGADISEFGASRLPPSLPELLERLEACPKPVIALLHGHALGGGLELALACHARVALPGARLGLPEVTLGLLPGAGGTQRLPRLLALEAAIDLILSGRQVGAEAALELGLIDGLGEGEPRQAALAAGRAALEGRLPLRRTGARAITPDPAVIARASADLAARRPALAAPAEALAALAEAGLPLAEGLRAERRRFERLMEGPERQALVHAFQAERRARAFPEAKARPLALTQTAVIGGGTMGVGIAAALLMADLPVALAETSPQCAAAAREAVAAVLETAVRRGKLAPEARTRQLAALQTGAGLEIVAGADLVIEAVFEDLALKQDIFRRLDALCRPGAVLASNTSYLDIDLIAGVTKRPEAVIGLHFFSPAHVMRLLEVVVAARTAPEVVATALALAARLGKVPVRSGVCDGFIGNRIFAHYRRAAEYMLLDGACFTQIDRALEDLGFALGPFAVADLAGLDIAWATRKRKAASRPADQRYVAIADRLCEQGWFGRKSGRGYYLYDPAVGAGGPRRPNPGALDVVAAERAAAGLAPRRFSDDEITTRYLTAMIAEAARVVEEGIARRPSDVDAVFLCGYGFPRHLGGPLHLADRLGAAQLVARIETYAQEDPEYWQVPGLLRDLARTGHSFQDLNKEASDDA